MPAEIGPATVDPINNTKIIEKMIFILIDFFNKKNIHEWTNKRYHLLQNSKPE